MNTITINFKGTIEVSPKEISVTDEHGFTVDTKRMKASIIIDRLKNGIYKLNFFETYVNAFDGNEEYEFELSED